MATGVLRKLSLWIVLAIFNSTAVLAQSKVPLGINYQAVARDNFGNELVNTKISVMFSIISGDPLSAPVYQELHQDVITSKFGVFSIVIGHGTPTMNSPVVTLSDVSWQSANHFLKVEVKFANDFMDMGTMQFMAVPYALYAQKSLEPGPVGPKGDQGDPATDDQTLSFNGSMLSISGGNTVPLNNLIQTLSVVPGADGKYLSISGGNSVNIASAESDGDPNNEIQDIILNSANNTITLSKSSAPAISLNDADADPQNEIQDLQLTGNKLSITRKSGAREIDMNTYLDNTDNQGLTYNESTNSISIDRGNSVTLGTMVAFRAKNTSSDIATIASYPVMTYDAVDYNVGNYLNPSTGIFTAPVDGIYTFNVTYYADGAGNGRELAIYVNTVLYEKLAVDIGASATILIRSVTLRLSASNTVSVVVYTGLATQTGTGSFSGFKVY